MKNILVPIDFNDNEKVLMNKALEFSKAFNAKIWLLHVASPEPEFVGFGVGPQYIRESRAKELRREHRLLNDYAEKIRLKGQQCDGLLISGATIEMILEKAKKLEIDLIITGHHDHSIFYQIFFGSTSKGVVNKSNIPVLIIPIKD